MNDKKPGDDQKSDDFLEFLSDVEEFLDHVIPQFCNNNNILVIHQEMVNVRVQKQNIEAEAFKLTKEMSLEEALKEFESYITLSK